MEKLDQAQQSAFKEFFVVLTMPDSSRRVNIASLSLAWNRIEAHRSNNEGSVEKVEAWCHLAMIAHKLLLDKAGFVEGAALAKLIFSDGFAVLQLANQIAYEKWADLCRMKEYEIEQYVDTYGMDDQSAQMSKELTSWGMRYAQYWARYQGDISGGICPTFIQAPSGGSVSRPISHLKDSALYAAIAIPAQDCLLRSDIPIFGVAGGTEFSSYVVEYGIGENPHQWSLIDKSEQPQMRFSNSHVPSLMEGDLDLRGNLATWNVGLKNWEHLPWHPASDTTDLNGVYSVRLTVVGRKGKKVEDRVTCEVGRVIAQCLPGTVVSADRKVTMYFPEQSLMSAFRVFGIRPATGKAPGLPADQILIGKIYQVREGGDRFIKPVILEMSYGTDLPDEADSSNLGMYAYVHKQHAWVRMDAGKSAGRSSLQTEVVALDSPKAYFAILSGKGAIAESIHVDRTGIDKRESAAHTALPAKENSQYVKDDFESGLSEWSERDGEAGASVTRVFDEGLEQNHYVKVVSKSNRGNFACNVVTTPFDVLEYPLVAFDYKIPKNTSVDLYMSVEGRWYEVGITNNADPYRYKDVNIASLGRIPGIEIDDEWHHAQFDLQALLRARTGKTRVDRIIIADWKVSGYMKLNFGVNTKGAAACFDNFTISRDSVLPKVPQGGGGMLIVDDFGGEGPINSLGGRSTVFSNPGTENCRAEVVRRSNEPSPSDTDRCLLIRYDVCQRSAYGGWVTSLQELNLSGCMYLTLEMSSDEEMPGCLVGLKDTHGNEAKVPLGYYLRIENKNRWRHALIPLVAFGSSLDFTSIENLSVSFEEGIGSDKGSMRIDNIQFHTKPDSDSFLGIEDFDKPILQPNAFGGRGWVFENGAAAISAERQKTSGIPSTGSSLRVSYGGTIGLDLGTEGFSYAGWAVGLGGVDMSSLDSLRFAVRGARGGERFNVYLDDSNKRYPVGNIRYGDVQKSWKYVSIPLRDFADHGVDLTHIEGIQFVFEWNEMSGTIWLDNISVVANKAVDSFTARQSETNR
jgi:hypothetical protein